MQQKRRKTRGNSILRIILVAVSMILQVVWILLLIQRLNDYSTRISLLTTLLGVVVVLRLYNKDTNSAMKMPWVALILAFPVMGLSMYLLFSLLDAPGIGKRLNAVQEQLLPELPRNEDVQEELEQQDLRGARQCDYLWKSGHFPVYDHTRVDYYGNTADILPVMKAELEKAERFIFMEYFIVEECSSFWELEDILVRKARQGVEVRLMYDDVGSISKVNLAFARRLNQEGICCQPFNPAMPLLNLFIDHRDHRKITVIDGKVGFTGGYNLADSYFGRAEPYGKWKDAGLRLEGPAVRSLTAAFLELWSVQRRKLEEQERLEGYLHIRHSTQAEGFVLPYTDNPLGPVRTAEDVYLNLINQANRVLYCMTPYLIITDEMSRALCLAAQRGVDVRIITPGIPDKKTVFAMTRSYYAGLARHGVRIYEYTPGFCHSKVMLCDGQLASVGTSNLDYRSLYHHFENDVLIGSCAAIQAIRADFDETFPQCSEVTEKYRSGRGAFLGIWQCVLRLFAPLV